jgi:predicted Zn-dependent peptidase
MPLYRVTIRFGAPKQQYHVEDIHANSLREALRLAAERFPDAALQSADLAEVRRQVEQEERSYSPE